MSRIAGLGMDLADMERVRQALRKNGEAFALRICTPDEWAYCRKLSLIHISEPTRP